MKPTTEPRALDPATRELWRTVRRALLMIARAIEAYCGSE